MRYVRTKPLLAGAQTTMGVQPSGWAIHRHHRRRESFLWATQRQDHHLLGSKLLWGAQPSRLGNSPTSPPARVIPVGFAATRPSPAGVKTTLGSPTLRLASSPPSPSVRVIPAGYAPTTPSPAGAITNSGKLTHPGDNFTAVTRRLFLFLRAAHRQHHRLLGG